MNILTANEIPPDHWLNEARFQWFRDGYCYASMQTRSIPALAKVGPGELYFAVVSIMRGAGIEVPDERNPPHPSSSPPSPGLSS